MFSKILTGLLMMAAVTVLGLSTVKAVSGNANKGCCFPGSACCAPGFACCENPSADCCYPGSPCCVAGSACCEAK